MQAQEKAGTPGGGADVGRGLWSLAGVVSAWCCGKGDGLCHGWNRFTNNSNTGTQVTSRCRAQVT